MPDNMPPTYPSNAFKRRSGVTGSDKHRSAFAQDRDRLLYSGAFRRLAGKSQVIASIEIGPFHTRLTHSLKVAQLGRRVAEQLRSRHERGEVVGPDPDLVEFACLAHDIGHPPFGHAGEHEMHKTLNELAGSGLEFGGFEGNPQSFRIVTRLAHKW